MVTPDLPSAEELGERMVAHAPTRHPTGRHLSPVRSGYLFINWNYERFAGHI